tara:strand:+ start:203 stop:379 length:177 start_codon:yes stop_codon:yes gene_type:complete
MEWILIILPLAFLHGWYVGRHFGIKLGAAGMFDQLYDNGIPVRGKLETRTIEISLKDE